MAKASHVSDVLAEVFRRGGMKRAVQRAEAVLLWPQVVGPEVARFTTAKSLQDGILYVEVGDSETGMHLMLQRQRFLDVYRGKFQVRDVRDIRFRVGRPAPPEAEAKPAPERQATVDPKALAALARNVSELPEALAKPTLQAAKALLGYRAQKRREGWEACELCGAMTPQAGLCETCARYAEEPRVIRTSRLLATRPESATPLLSDEERAVAVRLAKTYLLDRLRELLPQVLADPEHKLELEAVARCYVAHELGKRVDEVEDADLDVLEQRVARALGRWR